MRHRSSGILLSLVAVAPLAGSSAARSSAAEAAALVEIAAESGLDFHHFNGMSGKLYFAEHMGGAVAVFDYDGDGDLDVFLGQGQMLGAGDPMATPIPPRHPLPLTHRLYRNDTERDAAGRATLRFTDVTATSGFDAGAGTYNMGVATGDYDNDGSIDLYLTNLGPNQLWRNNGDGTFSDRSREAGVGDPRWSVAASFLDYDRDGWLDLYVGNYVEFRLITHKNCFSPTGLSDYCGPVAYPPEPNRLYRNRGDGTFEDTTAAMGMDGVAGPTLGTIAVDLDGDGWQDIYVANDQTPNEMWLNQEGRGFVDEAMLGGSAVDANGRPQASMGLVAEDFHGDGRIDLFVTHLAREINTLYRNEGDGMFADVTLGSGLGQPSWDYTGFGTAVLDYDLDGWLDIYVVNGGVKRIEAQLRAGDPLPLRQTNQLFRGTGPGRFEEVPAELRESEAHSEVSRGLAAGDLDNDGDIDLVLTNNAGPVRLLHNRTEPGDRWIGLRLLERTGRRDALGALAELLRKGEPPVWRRAHTDGSYTAARDPRVLFTVAPEDEVEGIDVRWPDGTSERFPAPARGAYVTLRQGTGRALSPSAAEP